jgi:hypothetical protein
MRDHARTAGRGEARSAQRSEENVPRRTIRGRAAFVLLFVLAAGCGRNAVRASEKEFLADQVMIFDEDGQEAAADDHVLTNREGSAGGRGARGGGCGCN